MLFCVYLPGFLAPATAGGLCAMFCSWATSIGTCSSSCAGGSLAACLRVQVSCSRLSVSLRLMEIILLLVVVLLIPDLVQSSRH